MKSVRIPNIQRFGRGKAQITKPVGSSPRRSAAERGRSNTLLGKARAVTRARTDQEFVEEMDEFIRTEIAKGPMTDAYRFQVHRAAFDRVIGHFSERAVAMRMIKDGYEGIINGIKRTCDEADERKAAANGNLAEMTAAIASQKEKLESKRGQISDVIDSVKVLLPELRDEVAQLKKDVVHTQTKLAWDVSEGLRLQEELINAEQIIVAMQKKRDEGKERLAQVKNDVVDVTKYRDNVQKSMTERLERLYKMTRDLETVKAEVVILAETENDPVHVAQEKIHKKCGQMKHEVLEVDEETQKIENQIAEVEKATERIRNKPPPGFVYKDEHAPLSISVSTAFSYTKG